MNLTMDEIGKGFNETNNLTYFYEGINLRLPFCPVVLCEFSTESISNNQSEQLRLPNCINESCRGSLIAFSVICAIFALVTTVCNLTVLIVIFSNKKLMDAQAVYRISLAFSDLLVGIFVYPSFIITIAKSIQSPLILENIAYKGNFEIINNNIVTSTIEDSNSNFVETYIYVTEEDRRLYNAFGVHAILNVGVSILTLVTAAIDRFKSVLRPLAYNKSTAQSFARNVSIVIWLAMILFSTFPLYVPEYSFYLLHPMLIIPDGPRVSMIFAAVLSIPLILMWVTTIATFVVYRITTKKRLRLMTIHIHKREIQQQMRLLFTLGIMVGVFTVCFVPFIILLLLYFLLNQDIAFNDYHITMMIAMFLLMSNSLWNFFIYNARNKDFRQTAKRLYLKLFSPTFFSRFSK